MAITFTGKTSGASVTNGPHTTASTTPAAGSLQLLVYAARQASVVDPVVPVAVGNGIAWQVAGTVAFSATPGTTKKRLTVFRAPAGAAPTTGTIVITSTGSTLTEGVWSLVEVAGMDTVGDPIVGAPQTNARNDSASATLTVNLPAFEAAGNSTFGAFAEDGGGTFTAGAGFTLVHSQVGSVVAVGTERLTSSDQTVDITTSASAGMGGVALEIRLALTAPIIKQHPSSTPRQVGDALHLDVLATPSSGTLTYQWQDNSGGSLANMSGETRQYLDVSALTIAMHTRQYRVLVTDSLGTTTSNTFVLAVSDRADDDYWLRDVPSDSDPNDVRLYDRPDVAAGGIVAVAVDSVAFSDAADAITTRVAVATDAITLTDSATAITERVAVATDTITFSDSAVSGAVLPVAAVDSVTFSDLAVAGASLPAVAVDTVSFSDSAVASTNIVATASDSITLSDSAEAITTRVATAADTLTLTDSAVATLVPPGGATAVAVDTVSFTDSAEAVLVPGTPVPPVNDGGHDWRRRTEGLMRTVRAAASDSVQFSDSAEAGVITALSLSSYLMARAAIATAQDGCLFSDEAQAQRWRATLVRTRQAQLIRSPIELVD